MPTNTAVAATPCLCRAAQLFYHTRQERVPAKWGRRPAKAKGKEKNVQGKRKSGWMELQAAADWRGIMALEREA